jgi:hypothetical protein
MSSKTNYEIVYEKDKTKDSGCTLAWKHVYPDVSIPDVFKLVRIGDCYDWSSPDLGLFKDAGIADPKKLLDYIYYKKYLSGFKMIGEMVKGGMERLVQINSELKDDAFYHVKAAADLLNSKKCAKKCTIGKLVSGDVEYTIAYAYMSSYVNGMGMLMRKYARKYHNVDPDFTLSWFYLPDVDKVVCSLRDQKKGLDLSKIALEVDGVVKEKKRGGGHQGAACFTFFGLDNFRKIIR